MYSFILPFCFSLLLGLLIIFTLSWHGAASFDMGNTVQAIHVQPTPRIGGAAIYIALIFTFLLMYYYSISHASTIDLLQKDILTIFVGMLISVIPIFLTGFIEDLTKRISVRLRLCVSLASGIISCVVMGTTVTTLDFYYLDFFMTIPLVAIIFTALCSAGVANAINMIDGLNGLAILVTLQILSGVGLVAYHYGDFVLVDLAIIFSGAVAGLFFLNWPFGKIFLGDGGAYLAGFFVAWLCILLNERNPSVSAFACLMMCSYPIIEVIYSAWRRIRSTVTAGKADSMHLHQLIYRRIACRLFKSASPVIQNSLAGLLCSILAIPAVIFAVLYHTNKIILICGFFMYFVFYILSYKALLRLEEGEGGRSTMVFGG
jgi:UDP-N-acetylmuramyl pentapeptide phosphotransferase/UDP-N-acetylglucosamine-1-phosphate transferase